MFTKIREFIWSKSPRATRMRLALALMLTLPMCATFSGSSMAADRDILLGCSAPALDSLRVPLDGARVVAVAQTPMAQDPANTTSAPMPLEVGSITLTAPAQVQPGQLLIADLITLGGAAPTITAPSGWQLIRDDSSPS